ncbi:hypothetical protein HX109_09835 [Galbibacter sp. BG1]|uniref:DUF6503 family protein n=1 Tax=Galbibacter sp. BG1 TaxID=1170699 RepID=UPI0015B8AE82|nr:DUF6503 family protein [Galbibacter sp. BG1]QLE01844.1 hypothetical protein HX109_09835 [Galbibacter sp. BG1]
MRTIIKLLFLSTIILTACKNKEEKAATKDATKSTSPFVESVEKAHNKKAFLSKNYIQFDIDIEFGGKPRLAGTLTMNTNSSEIRIDKKDGTTLFYDGKNVLLSPASTDEKGARFDMFTWAYFFALPYKLNDPGAQIEQLKDHELDSIPFDTAKLTFAKNTGDAPDDWYVLYADKNTGLMEAAGYIVTFGKSLEKAEANPHAIAYHKYEKEQNIPIATQWTFHNWTQQTGLGDTIGKGTLSNIKFVHKTSNFFKAPEDSKPITMD